MYNATLSGYTGSWTDFSLATFQDNNALFYHGQLQNAKMFRKHDVDFGIIPLPKYQDSQTLYYSPVTTYGSNCISIPIHATNYERTGIIVEALSCESRYTVEPAYYDIVIIGKTLQDPQSEGMLDIILSNRIFDIGYTFNWGGSYSTICDLTAQNRVTNVASSLASLEESTKSAILATLLKIS